MNKELGSYLDCTRFFAAFTVFLAHVQLNWVGGLPHLILTLGSESLAVLFVLSGFVIGHVSGSRETDLKTYLIHRAARVYSVTVPCLAIGFVLDSVGKHFMPHYYSNSFPLLASDSSNLLEALFSLTFLNEIWWNYSIPGSMAPFWTLPFEVLYYLLFGALWYLRGWWRWGLFAALCLGVGPEMLEYFPLWLMGFGAYKLCRHLDLSISTGRMIFFVSLLPWILCQVICRHSGFGYGQQEDPPLWPFYAVGLMFSVSTIGFCFAGFSISRYAGPIPWLAGATFTLYLLHFPLARFINGMVPFEWHAHVRWPLIVFSTFGISLIVAQYTERRKNVLRRNIERLAAAAERLFVIVDSKLRTARPF
jgi:peptidoglycan/LPS O-acetylase OafA/YrhL